MIRLSESPSEKYRWSGSPLRFENGSTAMALEAMVMAGFAVAWAGAAVVTAVVGRCRLPQAK